MEDISDADYNHAKRVCEESEIKYLGEYHDLYSCENVWNICFKIFSLNSANSLTGSG